MSTSPTRGDKVRETFKAKRARGEITGRVPMGYTVVYDKNGYNPKKVADSRLLKLIEEARQLRASGMSIRKIATEMAEKGLRSRGNSPLRPMSLYRILKNQSQDN